MNCDWKGWDRDPADDDEPWAGDADAWRGGVHGDDECWRAGVPEAAARSADDADHTWRGDLHLADWPEWDAGPEYLMWKTLRDRDADG